jgi:hypothetical protein
VQELNFLVIIPHKEAFLIQCPTQGSSTTGLKTGAHAVEQNMRKPDVHCKLYHFASDTSQQDGARGSVVVKALGYKPEDRGLETR